MSGHVADIEPNWTEKEFVDFEANVAAIDPAGLDAKPKISL